MVSMIVRFIFVYFLTLFLFRLGAGLWKLFMLGRTLHQAGSGASTSSRDGRVIDAEYEVIDDPKKE